MLSYMGRVGTMLDGDPWVGRKGPDLSERGPVAEECGCRTHPGGGTGWRGRLNRTARLDLVKNRGSRG